MITFAHTSVPGVDEYWASELGCSVEALGRTETEVVAHGRFGPYQGLFLFLRHAALIVSVPPDLLGGYRELAAALRPEALWDSRALASRLAGPRPIGRVVGPAFVGYLASRPEAPPASPDVRLLTPADADAVDHLRTACGVTEWEHSGSISAGEPAAGRFVDDELVALAGYKVWSDTIAHIGVITHPAHRGHGHGRAVVMRITQHALDQHLVPQYRTLEANIASISLGTAVGFERYAITVALRFGSSDGGGS
jgi:GNAT superfamily N-acetyltransferase